MAKGQRKRTRKSQKKVGVKKEVRKRCKDIKLPETPKSPTADTNQQPTVRRGIKAKIMKYYATAKLRAKNGIGFETPKPVDVVDEDADKSRNV